MDDTHMLQYSFTYMDIRGTFRSTPKPHMAKSSLAFTYSAFNRWRGTHPITRDRNSNMNEFGDNRDIITN